MAVEEQLEVSGTSKSLKNGFLRCSKWGWLVLLVIALMAPFCAQAQIGATATIQGTVTDSSGALIAGANVTAQNVATGVKFTRPADKVGFYVLSPLDPGDYTVTTSATGFETLIRTNIHVDGMQVLGLNLTLKVGAAGMTVTVTDAPPPLETENATLGVAMENDVYTSLPLEMGGANGVSTDQRRATDMAILMPGVTNNETKNNESDEPMVVNGNAQSTVMYIEGVPLESASVSGDPRYIWSAISVEAVDQFQLKTTAYSAEYQGLGVENFTIKSGTNKIHGSAYDVMRNTAFDAAGFIPAQYPASYPNPALAGTWYKPPEHMNEYGLSISGPIWKNKIFLFGNYMGFRYSTLTKPQAQTIPTPAELCGDFSATGINIYDPTSQKYSGGSYSRTQFKGASYTSAGCGTGPVTANVIPQGELSPVAKYMQQYWAGVQYLNTNLTNNYMGSYNWGLNNWSTTGRLDVNPNDKHKLSVILAAGRQGLIGLAGSQTTNVGPMPYFYAKPYAPITRVAIFQYTYLINQNLVNQFKYGAAQYHSPHTNPSTETPAYAATAAGIGFTNSPSAIAGQAANSFPIVKFTGTDAPAQWGPNAGADDQNTDTYAFTDNLQWLKGKHSFTFGGQLEFLEFNDLYAVGGTNPLTLNYAVGETASVSGSSGAAGTTNTATTGAGLPYASYLIGAVDSATYTEYAPNAPETGARYHPFALYVNDDWKATPKLTINVGLRWDSMPPVREAQNRMSFLNPILINPYTGTSGGLQFAGSGNDSCECSTPMKTYYKDWGPRLGFAYAANSKTVIRAAYGIYYAHGGGTSGGSNILPSSSMLAGLTAAPNPKTPGASLPAFYLNGNAASNFTGSPTVNGLSNVPTNTNFGGPGYNVVAPGTTTVNPGYGTYYSSASVSPNNISTTLSYLDPKYGGRTPTFEGWSFGFQRLVTKDLTATVSYVGNQGHFLLPYAAVSGTSAVARGYWGNQLDPKYLSLGSTILGAKTASSMPATANNGAGAWTYPSFNNTVAQDLVAFPQYSGVTDQVDSVGNSNYNALQLTVVQRLSRGLTLMAGYTFSRTIDDIGTFRTGYAIPAGLLANNPTKSVPIDRIERSLSTQDQRQNLVVTSTYDLPFGKGHIGGGNPIVRNIVGGWRISDIFMYVSGNPLAIISSACGNATGQGTCMPAYNTAFTPAGAKGNAARQNGKWGAGATRTTLASIQYINPAAFLQTTSTTLVNPNCTAGATACAGMLLGDVARTAPYDLHGPANYDIDGAVRRTFALWKDARVKFVFEASVFNAVNHVWFGSAASTADGTIGSSVTSSTPSSDTTLGTIAGQANSPRQFQFAGHFNF
jgi:hypothetical protein